LAYAQFGFFDQMFGHQQQHAQRGNSGGASQWAVHADAVSCSQYLCPDTLICVSRPADCPCPNVEDVKCTIPDSQDKGSATVLCVRGEKECASVEQLTRKHS
ncbi:hypothetical protein CONPUDRAFT_34922, partial [Coniophora puteana RWD-64-598 SS2]